MEWKNWSYVLFTERYRLPSCSGIYVIADVNNCVWYVGQATNLKDRWAGRGHHRYPQLIRSNRKLCHHIYWQPVPVDFLDEEERYYIDLFKPELNGCKVKKYLPKTPQVEREIKRLLTVINKPTSLFPIIRSVVAGYYEDNDGISSIVIMITVNDFDILYKSTKKRYSAEVKKAWGNYQTYCGRNEEQYTYKSIPIFTLNNTRFEFIQGLEILEYLWNEPNVRERYVSNTQLFGIEVKALKNLSILNELTLEEEWRYTDYQGKKSLTDAAYINYRKHLLQPVFTLDSNTRTEKEVYQSDALTLESLEVSLEKQPIAAKVDESETIQLDPNIPLLQVGDRVMCMLKDPDKFHYKFGYKWTEIDCAIGTVKRLKQTEIELKLDSGLTVNVPLEEIILNPLNKVDRI